MLVVGGDGGYCVINWAYTNQVLVFANGAVYRATDGGQDPDFRTQKEWEFLGTMMTEPIVGPPYNPSQPEDAKVVALGAGTEARKPIVYLSEDFGETWPMEVEVPSGAGIFAPNFASAPRFFIGTTAGEVFRVDHSGSSWKVTRLDAAAAGPFGLRGAISDIAIDWADASPASIYIAFGSISDYRQVWHFDGTRWEARSGLAGSGADNLLDVEHNAIVMDCEAPDNVYVGANIGVWHSPDRGQTWQPLPNGLPDALVFDLQMHSTRRLVRATIAIAPFLKDGTQKPVLDNAVASADGPTPTPAPGGLAPLS
jgi:hypothetical protein